MEDKNYKPINFMNRLLESCALLMLSLLPMSLYASEDEPLYSILTPHTISYVRSATIGADEYIIASSYDGEVLLIDYDGNIIWENSLSGYFNHDICCYDIDNDGSDEILAANANGALYCIDSDGNTLWAFKVNDVPMYSVTALELANGERVAVCGGYDTNFYTVRVDDGEMLSKFDSKEYSIIKGWGDDLTTEEKVKMQSINFLRRVTDSDGSDLLAIHGVVYANSTGGALYLVKLNDDSTMDVVMTTTDTGNLSIGSMTTTSAEGGRDKIILGQSGVKTELYLMQVDTEMETTDYISMYDNFTTQGLMDETGYRVIQSETMPNDDGSDYNYFILFGSRMFILERSKVEGGEMFTPDEGVNYAISQYSYNDMCLGKDNKIILASAQSGGSSIHILNPNQDGWADAVAALTPDGNIARILESSANLREDLDKFTRPSWEGDSQTVYLMTEDTDGEYESLTMSKGYSSPIFLGNNYTNKVQDPETWQRDTMSNEAYRDTRDSRFYYTRTQSDAVATLAACYNDYGGSYWGGHGNDPYFYPATTIQQAVSSSSAVGKKSVIVYPEVHDTSSDFEYVMATHFRPMAEYFIDNNIDAKLYLRSKDIFWISSIYLDSWSDVASGQFREVFVASMEETSSRTMELSLSGRVGVWTADCVESWGARLARDNTSHDRLRQDSHQMLPNHFLRQMVYNSSLGAQYMDNIEVDQEYMSLFWDMLGRGLIFVPRVDQLLSISPLHLAMRTPDDDFMAEGTLSKWTILYDDATNNSYTNPMVFDRMNATWIAGVVNEWDFSNYAAGVKDRRLSFLPSFSNGFVMITPADESNQYRSEVSQNLHPIYRDIMRKVETDGKYYYDNGTHDAISYYPTMVEMLEERSKLIPITVSGDDVAWVAAQSAPCHIRLTLVDGGYIDPDDRVARVKFNTVQPVSISDLLTGEKYLMNSSNEVDIPISAGLFRFLDVEIEEEL